MRKNVAKLVLAVLSLAAAPLSFAAVCESGDAAMECFRTYRGYNQPAGRHLFTPAQSELQKGGYRDEGGFASYFPKNKWRTDLRNPSLRFFDVRRCIVWREGKETRSHYYFLDRNNGVVPRDCAQEGRVARVASEPFYIWYKGQKISVTTQLWLCAWTRPKDKFWHTQDSILTTSVKEKESIMSVFEAQERNPFCRQLGWINDQ